MVNIIAEGFTQRIDRFFIKRFELRKRLFWGQPGGFLIHDVLLVSALLTFCLVCHRLKKAQDNLTRLVEKVLRLEPVDAGGCRLMRGDIRDGAPAFSAEMRGVEHF